MGVDEGLPAITELLASGLPVPAYQVGRLIVIGEPVLPDAPAGSTVVYAGVSAADQRPDLDRQEARVTGWATGGAPVGGSGGD
jgi:predicted site-specific integrase-resolvase